MSNDKKYKTHTSTEVKERHIYKTYVRAQINLRKDSDGDLIDYLDKRRVEGVFATDVFRELYDIAKRNGEL